MIVILLPSMIKPSITTGRINIYERINDYRLSFSCWNKLADIISNKIYIFENSGYGNVFNLNEKIIYISEDIQYELDTKQKGKSLALTLKRFLEIANLNDNDKVFVMTGRFCPVDNIFKLLELMENNECVISGMEPINPLYLYNSRWFSLPVYMMKKLISACIDKCLEGIYDFEQSLVDIITQSNNLYVYNKYVNIVPTFQGGLNNFITKI